MSANKIKDIKQYEHIAGKSFFMDANVWLLKLKSPYDLKTYELAYIDFFDKVIQNDEAIIVINNVLISELMNTFLRMAFGDYKACLIATGEDKAKIQKLDFKKDYRGSDDYCNKLEIFKDDFASYHGKVIFEEIDKVDPVYLVKSIPVTTDYNDYFYYESALENDYSIVTNDTDFIYPDIEIISNHRDILKLI